MEGRGKNLSRGLRIAMIGMRGLPADLPKAGGGERETEGKAIRLAQRGHKVTVYCRWHYNRHPISPYEGVHLISLPSIPSKHLDTVSHTLLATLDVIFRNIADIVHYHGMGNGLFLPLLKLFGKKSVLYLDGVDWERPKWGKLAKFILKISAWLAFHFADVVYVDNYTSQKIFAKRFGRIPEVITLGADLWDPPGHDLLSNFGLEPEKYILFVGVLRPDKGVHLLIEAYRHIKTDMPLVIVGDNRDEHNYIRNLKEMANQNVRFLGYVYGNTVRQLFSNCYLYVQPSLVEGNSPALLTAMACARCVVVNGIEQNIETIGDAGITFPPNDVAKLCEILIKLIQDPHRVKDLGFKARQRVNQFYNWEKVVENLEQLYNSLAKP